MAWEVMLRNFLTSILLQITDFRKRSLRTPTDEAASSADSRVTFRHFIGNTKLVHASFGLFKQLDPICLTRDGMLSCLFHNRPTL
jgi:hypothetical protein